ncbi:MAG: hypothetical protein WEB60_06910 [Terrimicrobiaceae bacterium]
MINSYDWTTGLKAIYDKSVAQYLSGNHDVTSHFSPEETAALAEIGLRPINVFDYAEDFARYQEPSWETFLLVAAARRDYFLHEQQGATSSEVISEAELPAKTDVLDGIPWLPRIIRKAQCFLEGGLCHDIMYGCGGDRRFLKEHAIHAADLLRIVWASRGDDQKVLRYLRESNLKE